MFSVHSSFKCIVGKAGAVINGLLLPEKRDWFLPITFCSCLVAPIIKQFSLQALEEHLVSLVLTFSLLMDGKAG